MNSLLASSITGTFNNQQVANGSSSILLSSIDFSVTSVMTNTTSCQLGKPIIKLTGTEEMLHNGQIKTKSCDQNKNTIENIISVNGNKEKSPEDTIPVPKIQLYTGKIHTEWNQVHKIGAGLINLGNTCFMNTVIQCLTYCPPLANYLLHDNDHSTKCTITGFCMMCLLQRHMKRAIGKTGDVIKPLDVYQRLKLIAKHFQFGRQEDAHEFLRYVIDHLWKSCLIQTNGVAKLDSASKETTVINKIFGGYHRSQVICLRCKKESNTFDHFMDFILDIKQNVMSLEKALEKFTQPELLQHENSYKCPKCKMKVDAQKRFSVFRTPNVATFQLKRFDYNRSFGGKITKPITYPEKLNLRPYMSDTQGDPVWYRLNAVLVHSGPTCNSGHYYCYVKNSNGIWYIMDDQRVNEVSLNRVLSQSAYVLFYIKMDGMERAPLKKCLDNKTAVMKGTVSNSVFSKVTEMNNVKTMPLNEKNSFSNAKPYSSPNSVKKFIFSSPQREKISFGIRSNVTSTPLSSSKCRTVSSEPASAVHGGLVPYVEDSSESSDASESNPSQTKPNSVPDSDVKLLSKSGSLESYKSSPHLEVKTKLSKPVFGTPSHSLVKSSQSSVSATGSWIVTDALPSTASSSSNTSVNSIKDTGETSQSPVKPNSTSDSDAKHISKYGSIESYKSSPRLEVKTKLSKPLFGTPSHSIQPVVSATNSCWIVTDAPPTPSPSSSSTTGVNSTTDWHVIEVPDLKLHGSPRINENKNSFIKESLPSPKRASPDLTALKNATNMNDTLAMDPSSDAKMSNGYESGISAQNCTFRRQILKDKRCFPKDEENGNSFKRKSSVSYSKLPKDSPYFEHGESRYSPVSKKIKHAENSSFLNPENDERNSGSNVRISDSSPQHRQYSSSNCDKNSRTCLVNGVSGTENCAKPSPNKMSVNVNRTIEMSPEKAKQEGSHSGSSSSFTYEKQKMPLSNQGSNASLYGTEVPTWREENHYQPSLDTGQEVRRSFDNYDNEFDRGKVRKSKTKNRYQYFHRHNPFQKFADRDYRKYNNNGKYYYNHHHNHRKFDSRHSWKSNHNNGYQRYNSHHC